MPENVLVVSASTGSGHAQAAEAVKEGLLAEDRGIHVEHVDLLDLAPRWVRVAVGNGYELMATRTPRVWEGLYRRTDLASPDTAKWGPIVHRALFGEFRQLLRSRPWSGCICTHFLPGQLAAGAPGSPPFGMVVTDMTLHHVWAQPRIHQFFAPNTQLAAALRARIPNAAVDVTGIPVSLRFAAPPDQASARAALGLHPLEPTVLVMGGGMGAGIDSAALAVAGADVRNLQIVAVCGRNAGAAERLAQAARSNPRLRVRGFVPDVENYIAAADIVVTKPGGITTSEVLAVGRPMILSRAIPGQEEGNAAHLRAAGVATYAPTPDALARAVETLIPDSRVLRAQTLATAALGRPAAAVDVARLFLGRLGGRLAA